MNEIIIIILAPLVLLESREVIQGFWSLPVLISFLLIFLGNDPLLILVVASVVQVVYHGRIASGTVKFPEYSYSFWTLCGMSFILHDFVSQNYLFFVLFFIALIILLANGSAYLLQFKRILLEKIVYKLPIMQQNLSLMLICSLVLSYTIFIFPVLLVYMFFNYLAYWVIGYSHYFHQNLYLSIASGLILLLIFLRPLLVIRKLNMDFLVLIVGVLFSFMLNCLM